MRRLSLSRLVILVVLTLLLGPSLVHAATPKWDLPPRLVAEPPGLAQLRAQYAPLTVAQLTAAGFQLDATYITAAMVGLPASTGAMGYHAINPTRMNAQFPQGVMDPQQPPVVLLGPDKRVIGVEWEAADRGQPAPQLYGQMANLGPAHPGVDQPHYMLHAFFRPNGQVLFGDFDPALATPGLPNTGGGGGQALGRTPWPFIAILLVAVLPLGVGLARRRWVRRA